MLRGSWNNRENLHFVELSQIASAIRKVQDIKSSCTDTPVYEMARLNSSSLPKSPRYSTCKLGNSIWRPLRSFNQLGVNRSGARFEGLLWIMRKLVWKFWSVFARFLACFTTLMHVSLIPDCTSCDTSFSCIFVAIKSSPHELEGFAQVGVIACFLADFVPRMRAFADSRCSYVCYIGFVDCTGNLKLALRVGAFELSQLDSCDVTSFFLSFFLSNYSHSQCWKPGWETGLPPPV